MQEFGEDRGVGKSDLAVKCVDSSNMDSFRGQQTRDQIDVAWTIASWWDVEGKLCDDFICSMVSAATWNTNLLLRLTEHFDRQPLNWRLTRSVRFLNLDLRGLLRPWELQVPARQLRNAGPQGGIALAPTLAPRSYGLPFRAPAAPAAAVAGAGPGTVADIMHGVWRCRHGGIDGLKEGLCYAWPHDGWSV